MWRENKVQNMFFHVDTPIVANYEKLPLYQEQFKLFQHQSWSGLENQSADLNWGRQGWSSQNVPESLLHFTKCCEICRPLKPVPASVSSSIHIMILNLLILILHIDSSSSALVIFCRYKTWQFLNLVPPPQLWHSNPPETQEGQPGTPTRLRASLAEVRLTCGQT